MKAVRVDIGEAEILRQSLLSEGALDRTRKLRRNNGFIEIPVSEYYSRDGLEIIEQEKPEFYLPKKTLRDLPDIPEHEKKLLPSGWQILGEVIIVSLNHELEAFSSELSTRPQVVALNKVDLKEARDMLPGLLNFFRTQGIKVFPVSAVTGEGLKELVNYVGKEVERLKKLLGN